MNKPIKISGITTCAKAVVKLFSICTFIFIMLLGDTGHAQTALGELEGRPAPVALRKCSGTTTLCNDSADCGGTCPDRNVFNISVAILFNANNTQLTAIQNMISGCSADLFDVTDGQAEIGEAFLYNNAVGTGTSADLIVYPASNDTWWQANTGSWQVGGSMHVSINYVTGGTDPGESLAHEFIHLAFDARDEYESRAVGCGAATNGFSCPHPDAIAAGEASCLMDNGGGAGDFSEFCWGQGDPGNTTDISGGNHDADNNTEQSRCRSNRSCWAQIVWAYPNTFVQPTGAPDPAANGATVNPTQFIIAQSTTRVVLVLDESGSMDLEAPSRMERLKVAAKDFITLAETGTEVGIVSYSDNASSPPHANIAISALGADRSNWNDAIDDLNPDGWTNIGDGLEEAMDLITAAGGVTANTYIVLMSDGLNNRPSPQATADADLQAEIANLMSEGVPVFVTCTGSDLGLSSQCSEIATGTGGFYVDSSDPARLAEAFVDFYETIAQRDPISSVISWENQGSPVYFVEEDSQSATFTLVWHDGNSEKKASMTMIDPNGGEHRSLYMPQGRYTRVQNPIPGEWRMLIDWSGDPGPYVARAYSKNQFHSLNASVRYASVLPGEEITVYAYPRSNGGSVTDSTSVMTARVKRPDGTIDTIELNDAGNVASQGDDILNDGIFTGVYRNTSLKGSYEFLIQANIDNWMQSMELHEHNPDIRSAKFNREVRISAAVGDPNDVELTPEDDPKDPGGDPKDIPIWMIWTIIILLLLLLLMMLICCFFRKRG